MKHPVLPLLLAASLMAACHSARVVPSASSRLVACDTVESHGLRYDSVFVLHDVRQDYRRAAMPDTVLCQMAPDTVYLRDTRVEYRLRLVRDTLREVRTDTVVSEVTSPPAPYRVPWYDRVARTIAVAFFIALALVLAFPADSRKS